MFWGLKSAIATKRRCFKPIHFLGRRKRIEELWRSNIWVFTDNTTRQSNCVEYHAAVTRRCRCLVRSHRRRWWKVVGPSEVWWRAWSCSWVWWGEFSKLDRLSRDSEKKNNIVVDHVWHKNGWSRGAENVHQCSTQKKLVRACWQVCDTRATPCRP